MNPFEYYGKKTEKASAMIIKKNGLLFVNLENDPWRRRHATIDITNTAKKDGSASAPLRNVKLVKVNINTRICHVFLYSLITTKNDNKK